MRGERRSGVGDRYITRPKQQQKTNKEHVQKNVYNSSQRLVRSEVRKGDSSHEHE